MNEPQLTCQVGEKVGKKLQKEEGQFKIEEGVKQCLVVDRVIDFGDVGLNDGIELMCLLDVSEEGVENHHVVGVC